MTNVIRNTLLAVAGTLLMVAAQSSLAVPITWEFEPADADWVSNDNSALNGADVQSLVGTSSILTLLYKSNYNNDRETFTAATFDEGSFSGSYTTAFSGDPNNATISHQQGESAIQCPECYLVVKDGEQPQYLFNIGDWDGTSTIKLTNFYTDTGAISHVAIFGKFTGVTVPEPGTALLIATGIFGLIASRKRMKKAV